MYHDNEKYIHSHGKMTTKPKYPQEYNNKDTIMKHVYFVV